MDVKDILKAAWQAVGDAEIPDDQRSIAFGKAIDLLSGAVSPVSESGRVSTKPNLSRNEEVVAKNNLSKIAQRLKLLDEEVAEVYYEQGEELRLTISSGDLVRGNKKAATQQLALLVAAMRQGADREDTTSTDTIRETVDDFGQLDPSNFASHISDMSDKFQLVGNGRSRSVKLRRTGWEAAAELVRSLAGGDA